MAEGISRAKSGKELQRDGKTLKYTGRKPTAREKDAEVLALAADKRGPSYIAEKLKPHVRPPDFEGGEAAKLVSGAKVVG